ncbi:vegetative cell wall protein gp1-like isoform X2 [Photinus pyralis]|nr:vegetative cell wall protein gp1-like isoform X2 [Photinus pyralis]
MSGQGPGGRGGGWSPLHFRPPSPYGPSPPPRFGSPGMPMFATRHPHMPAPRPRWPSPLPHGASPPPIPPSPRPFRMPMHPPSPAPTRCSTPDYFRGISPYIQNDIGPPVREYDIVGIPLEPPPLPKNYEPEEEETGPSTAEIIANQSQDYIDEKLAEYQATIYLLQDEQERVQKKTFVNWINSYLAKVS